MKPFASSWSSKTNSRQEDMQLDPYEYVQENREQLKRIVRHGSDEFTRALALQFLVEYGGERDLKQIKREVELALEVAES